MVIELTNCPDPHRVLREAAVPGLAEALALREVERPDGTREVLQPGTVELPGARVHVIPLQQEMRSDGTITPPAAVVVVDGPQAGAVVAELDKALLAAAEVRGDHAELPSGARVVLDGPPLAETGAKLRVAKAERLALVEMMKMQEATAATGIISK